MWTKSINIEVILICLLSQIPWPTPGVFKLQCSRDSARVVRKIVQSRWLPILDKYKVKLPLECPFHPVRDIFAPQQTAKVQNRRNQWTCSLCGKSFFEEKHLDMHFDARHSHIINEAEDAICFANFCDIMRCKVLLAKDAISFDDTTASTDIEVWNAANAYRAAISSAGPKHVSKSPNRRQFTRTQPSKTSGNHCNADTLNAKHSRCYQNRMSNDDNDGDNNNEQMENSENENNDSEKSSNSTNSHEESLVESATPTMDQKERIITEFERKKANCKTDDLEKLQSKCQILVRDCIAGLLVQLSNEDFKTMEDELNRAICWYLTCDRYWEDGKIEQRAFPWALVFFIVLVLSFGVCFCYYIVWVLFDSDDSYTPPPSMPTSSMQNVHLSPTHNIHNQQQIYNQSHYSSGTLTPTMHNPHHLHPHHQPHFGSAASASMSNLPVSVNVNQMPTSRSTTPAGPPPDDPFYAAQDFNDLGQSEHYIYVTYPPELKRRLLESCYNRTTRL